MLLMHLMCIVVRSVVKDFQRYRTVKAGFVEIKFTYYVRATETINLMKLMFCQVFILQNL